MSDPPVTRRSGADPSAGWSRADEVGIRWPSGSTLILLSGGSSRRLGRDKATTHVGGRTLLVRLLEEVPRDVPVVLVGPSVPELAVPDLSRRVTVVREDPPGSGPLAGIDAGVTAVRTPLVGVLAADMPFSTPVVGRLLLTLSEIPEVDAVVPVDAQGHRQLLAAAYRTDALVRALTALQPPGGRAVRALLAALRVMEWPAADEVLIDIDTSEALRAARTRAAEEGAGMEQWLQAVSEALGLDVAVDVDTVLDVARDAASAVARPAAPVTTFLLGAAVARGADAQDAAATIARLAAEWGEGSG